MTPISVCIIAKNEEKHMDIFLSSIKQFLKDCPHELIFVDTGSTDKTKELAAKYTDTIFDFPWINDFSAARNFSISKASHDWILVLDCDETITHLDINNIQEFIHKYPNSIGMLTRLNHYEMNGTDSVYTDKVERLFHRDYFHYEAIIHEQVVPLTKEPFYKIDISLVVDHSGYNGTLEEIQQKVERNNSLLLKMLEETPDNPYLYFQLGQSYNMLHDDEKAAYYYGKGLEYNVDPKEEYVQMMVIGYGYALLHLERYEEALFFENIYDEFAVSADFVGLMGLIYLRSGHILKAMPQFLKATTMEVAHVTGANSFIPTYNMGFVNEMLRDKETAILLYQKCGDFKPALERLEVLGAKK